MSGNKFIPGNEINNGLYKAIYSGDLENVQLFIDKFGFSYSSMWKEGYDLLLTALECKHVDVAKLLIVLGCKVEAPEPGATGIKKSLIHISVRLGDVELIIMLLERITNALTKTEQGDSPLHAAVVEGQDKIVKLLLDSGADIECKNGGGMTPLHLASVSRQIEILELLLTSGSDIESEDNNGKTSLFLAVSSGNLVVVKILLKHGANVRCKSKNGLTPLLDATSKGYVEIVHELLNFGADCNNRNSVGQTPLHIACMHKNKSLITTLLNAGANVNAEDTTGMVPCDAIVMKVSPLSNFFENSSIVYVFGKHFLILKIGGFYLNKKNQTFYDKFYNMYCGEITVGEEVISATSTTFHSIIKSCEKEIFLMKHMKSESGFTVYDIFRKLKNPLSRVTENEMKFLLSSDFEQEFSFYNFIIRNLLKTAKLRNELLASSQQWFSYMINLNEENIPLLPEEMNIHMLSFLSNDELKQLISCCKEICAQNKSV